MKSNKNSLLEMDRKFNNTKHCSTRGITLHFPSHCKQYISEKYSLRSTEIKCQVCKKVNTTSEKKLPISERHRKNY